MRTPDAHDRLARDVAAQIADHRRRADGRPLRIRHGGTHSTRDGASDACDYVDVGALDQVIDIDPDRRIAWVEANVSMSRLVAATLPHGLVPPVVPEFPQITIGGAIQGGAGESSSFRHGAVFDTCDELELVLGDGARVVVSPTRQPELFYSISGSCGSLGVLTSAKIRLIPAHPYVETTYTPTGGTAATLAALLAAVARPDVDFVEGIVLSQDRAVVITGRFVPTASGPVRRFSRFHDRWFWRHAEARAAGGAVQRDLVPVRDYLFRYDRGAFWMGEYLFRKLRVPGGRPMTAIFDPILHTREMYRAMREARVAQNLFVQDFGLPWGRAGEFIDWVHSRLDVYPLWLCPGRLATTPQKLSLHHVEAHDVNPSDYPEGQILDVGVWGQSPVYIDNYWDVNREAEQFVAARRGRKVLYAHAFYPESEFWSLYDRAWYAARRAEAAAEGVFPDVWRKTFVGLTREAYRRKPLGLGTVIGSFAKIAPRLVWDRCRGE